MDKVIDWLSFYNVRRSHSTLNAQLRQPYDVRDNLSGRQARPSGLFSTAIEIRQTGGRGQLADLLEYCSAIYLGSLKQPLKILTNRGEASVQAERLARPEDDRPGHQRLAA
jgi:hypothetical protein